MFRPTTLMRLGTPLISLSLLLALGCSDDDGENNKKDNTGNQTNMTATMTGTMTGTMTNTTPTNATNTTPTNTATNTNTNAATARAQILHLVSGAGAVDVYIDGERKVDDFEEFKATPFLELPVGSPLEIKIFAGTDTDDSGTALITGMATPEAGKFYTIAAVGDPAATAGAPTELQLLVQDGALQQGTDTTQVSARVIHASPDVGQVDIVTVSLPSANADATVVGAADFGAITPEYVSLPNSGLPYGAIALFDVRTADSKRFIANAQSPALTTLGGVALTIAAVGNTTNNTFRLVAFTATGDAIPLNAGARAQLIHNSPSKGAAEEVDVFLKLGETYQPFFDNLGYRQASPFVSIPSGSPLTVGIDADDDATVIDITDGLETSMVAPGATVALVASGIVGNNATPFTLAVVPAKEPKAGGPPVDGLDTSSATFFHGVPGAPAVGARIAGTTDALFTTPLSYLGMTASVMIPRTLNAVLEVYEGADATGPALYRTAAPVDAATLPDYVFIAASGLIGDAEKPLGLIAVNPDGNVIHHSPWSIPKDCALSGRHVPA